MRWIGGGGGIYPTLFEANYPAVTRDIADFFVNNKNGRNLGGDKSYVLMKTFIKMLMLVISSYLQFATSSIMSSFSSLMPTHILSTTTG